MVGANLEAQIYYMKDIHEIKNLMSRYQYLYTAGKYEEIIELFSHKIPGSRVTVSGLGVWEGIEGVKKYYAGYIDFIAGDRIGKMEAYVITNPLIEVAGDGKTAKAAWISPGALSVQDEDGTFKAMWHWVKCATDFVKEDRQWKFWHYHIYTIFRTPYEKSWVEESSQFLAPVPVQFKPDKTDDADYSYSTTSTQVLVPVPPEPYETFDERMAY